MKTLKKLKLKIRIPIIYFVLLLLLNSCAMTRYQRQGFVTNVDYLTEIHFDYINNFIFVPLTIEGKQYNFLFDTGAELNLIDTRIAEELNLTYLKKGTISNSKDSEKRIPIVEINEISIGGIEFSESVGMIWDLSKFGKLIGCVKIDGLLGNNFMRKANWQIDYKNRVIRISDKIENFEIAENPRKIKMNSGENGNVKLILNILNENRKFTFDTGYNGTVQSGDVSLLENQKYLTKVGSTGANFSGEKYGEMYLCRLDSFTVNGVQFQTPALLSVKPKRSSVLGNKFYENYNLTIDWKRDTLFLDPHENLKVEIPELFEVTIYPNYQKREVLVGGVFKNSSLFGQVDINSKVVKINNFNVDNLNEKELCNFWNKEWTGIQKENKFTISIVGENGEMKEIVVKKMKNVL